jgi:hypothetical protein
MFKYTDAWYQLSEEERNSYFSKIQEAYEKVGGKLFIIDPRSGQAGDNSADGPAG